MYFRVMTPPPPPRPPPSPPFPQSEKGGESDSEPPEKKQKTDEKLTALDGKDEMESDDLDGEDEMEWDDLDGEDEMESDDLDGEGESDSDDSESSRFGRLSPLSKSMVPLGNTKIYTIDNCDMADDLYRPTFPGDILGDEACWKKYFQQIHESEGFDFKDFPGHGPLTSVHPYIPTEEMKSYATLALERYNKKKGTKYEVNEIIKVNRETCRYFSYYITFTVMDGSGEKIYFQAKVCEDIDNSLKVVIVRPRAKGGLDI